MNHTIVSTGEDGIHNATTLRGVKDHGIRGPKSRAPAAPASSHALCDFVMWKKGIMTAVFSVFFLPALAAVRSQIRDLRAARVRWEGERK